MPPPRILVVDDDQNMLSLLRRGLSFAGYAVHLAADGDQALLMARDQPPDLVVLDVMLPGVDGVEVCRRLRADDPELPILMLTARDQVPDRVTGLRAGADDYVLKPFAFEELLARIQALLRRSHRSDVSALRFADLALDPMTRDVERGGERLDLTAKEYEVLEFFMRHPRYVFSRDVIYECVWGSELLTGSNVIDVLVMRLREKLEAGEKPRLLHTIRGAGYSLREG
jgi:two-component system response regulator MprA